jgi:hypothetical protein
VARARGAQRCSAAAHARCGGVALLRSACSAVVHTRESAQTLAAPPPLPLRMAALRPRRPRASAPDTRAAAPAAAAPAAADGTTAALSPASLPLPLPLPPLPPLPPPPRKVLYVRSAGVEDDATDERFLEELILNLNVRPRSYWVVVRASVPIAQQLSVAVGAALLFAVVAEGALQPDALLCIDGARKKRETETRKHTHAAFAPRGDCHGAL